jgi:uncharacterized protein (TIGR02996 family)
VFRVEITDREGVVQCMVLDKPEITIGRIQGNDIVLAMGNISKRHARCVERDGKLIVVDLKSTNGTFVNGRKLTSPLVIHDSDKVLIGDFTLVIGAEDSVDDDTVEVDATELRLLAAIAQRDEASRVVYADWLEERGDIVRAEFLRVQEALVATAPEAPEFRERTERMQELAAGIDLSWRYKVARPVVENCLAVEFECPREWGALATTERSSVRYCGACAKRVFYCATVDEARRHAGRGNCVAVDVVQLRRPNDLDPEPRRMVMGGFLPGPAYDDTPRPQPPPPPPPTPRMVLPPRPPPPIRPK